MRHGAGRADVTNTAWVSWPVAPRLARYVLSMEGYEEFSNVAVTNTQLPTTVVPLIFMLGPGFCQRHLHSGAHLRELANSFVAGLHTHAVGIGSAGRAACIQVNLNAVGARRVLRVNMSALTDQIIDVRDVLHQSAARIEDKLLRSDDWHSRFELLEDWLEERLFDKRARSATASEAVLHQLQRCRGTTQIEQLAASSGYSRKHLNYLFKQDVGASPKLVARILRFECAMELLQQAHPPTLADIAARAGYADQAHFTREFAEFSGSTPGAYSAAAGG